MKTKTDLNRRAFLSRVARPDGSAPPGHMTFRSTRDGARVSLLGYGMMRLPTVDGGHANGWAPGSSSKAIDQEEVNAQIDWALGHGVNYFDTSPVYCRGESERVTGIALSRHPRSKYFIATKMSNFNESLWPAEKSKAMFEKSLSSLRTDYIDFYLLHAIGNGGFKTFSARYLENGILDWLAAQREAGRIRHLGFSYHGDPKAFEWCMEHHGEYKWDFAQIQLNYVDWRHAKEVNKRNLDAQYLYAELSKRNIPAVVMEPLLGGRLAKFNFTLAERLTPLDPEASLARWAMRFAGSPPGVLTVLSGMTYREHLYENTATYSPLKPVTDAEKVALEEAAQALLADKTVPCNTCDYCMPCPYGLDIPGIFTVYNRALAEKRLPDDPTAPDYRARRKAFLIDYENAVAPLRRADHCTGCGRCSPHCPQSIDIPREIRRVDEFVEGLKRDA